MTNATPTAPVITLKQALEISEANHFAIGSFSPRYTPMIAAVLKAGQIANSPLIVQISHKELIRYGITAAEFGEEFYRQVKEQQITVPVVLHLDHTKELETIKEAIAAGFTSVMIDASEKPFTENAEISKEVVEYAHTKGVSVESELGMIGTTDFVETDKDEELYTNPQEAAEFVAMTGVDALAVSCGTAHGVYVVKQPKIDYDRLMEIRRLTPVHLVLHGGSGVPPEMMRRAYQLPGGGVSKVNIATDLELSLLKALGREERMTNEECKNLAPDKLQVGCDAVTQTVMEKMKHFLNSAGKADVFNK